MKMRCYCPRLSKTPKVSELVLLSVTGLCCGHGTVLVGPGPVASLVAQRGTLACTEEPGGKGLGSERDKVPDSLPRFPWHLLSLLS